MNGLSKNLSQKIHGTAKKAVSAYVQGILTIETLSQLIAQEWVTLYPEKHGEIVDGEDVIEPRDNVENKEDKGKESDKQTSKAKEEHSLSTTLWRIAQRICSATLYDSLRSLDEQIQERATQNITHYMVSILHISGFARTLQPYNNATDDAINRTLREVYKIRVQEKVLRDPAALLKWVQVIIKHKAQAVLEEQEEHISLEQVMEHSPEQFVNNDSQDPLKRVLSEEQREVLLHLLAEMRNKQYMQVILYDYLEDLDDAEIAQRMGVSKKKVQMWRHRGLKWLRKRLNPD